MLQERQVALIRELLSDKDTMSRLNDNERQTLMQLSQCHHDDMTSPRKRYVRWPEGSHIQIKNVAAN